MGINILILAMVFVPILLGLMPLFVKNDKTVNLTLVIVSIIELICSLYLLFNIDLYNGTIISLNWFAGLGINFEVNGLGILQAVATSLIWIGASVFSKEYFSNKSKNILRYYGFFSVVFGATMGIFLASDLFTLFIFFEIMSLLSYPLVVHNQDQDAIDAGNSYLAFSVIGGLVMLMGIFILYSLTGTLVISQLATACSNLQASPMLVASGFMIFVGFAIKSGLFPFNGWLPKSYPASPAPFSACLSSVLSKTGVYGVIIVTFRILQGNVAWASFVLAIGVITMFFGAFFAFLSKDLKETLAYSSMSQIGFITVGVAMTQLLGEHGTIAAYGTVLHMFNHTCIKLILFTLAGVVFQNIHSLNLNDISGFGRKNPLIKVYYSIAALSIMGIPLFSGFISKTLLHEAIVEKIWMFDTFSLGAGLMQLSEMMFLLSGGFTVAYMLKLFIVLFINKPSTKVLKVKNVLFTKQTKIILGCVSFILLFMGLMPYTIMDNIAGITASFMGVHPLDSQVNYFAFVNIKGALISVTIGLILYFIVAKNSFITKEKGYVNPWNGKVSVENLIYKPIIFTVLPNVFGFISRIFDILADLFIYIFNFIFCRDTKIPPSFFEGKKYSPKEDASNKKISITKSLEYSLLLYGLGFVIIMLYLLFAV